MRVEFLFQIRVKLPGVINCVQKRGNIEDLEKQNKQTRTKAVGPPNLPLEIWNNLRTEHGCWLKGEAVRRGWPGVAPVPVSPLQLPLQPPLYFRC